MRHYEIIYMIHPDQTQKVNDIISYYKNIVNISKGKVHRLEDWGRRTLSYPIKKLYKAHYILMNVEIFPNVMYELENSLRFNDAVIRNMIIRVKSAIIEPSPMLKIIQEESSE